MTTIDCATCTHEKYAHYGSGKTVPICEKHWQERNKEKVSVKKQSETHRIDVDNFTIYCEVANNKLSIQTQQFDDEFIFKKTTRENVRKIALALLKCTTI